VKSEDGGGLVGSGLGEFRYYAVDSRDDPGDLGRCVTCEFIGIGEKCSKRAFIKWDPRIGSDLIDK
jgi:hypothetical protein